MHSKCDCKLYNAIQCLTSLRADCSQSVYFFLESHHLLNKIFLILHVTNPTVEYSNLIKWLGSIRSIFEQNWTQKFVWESLIMFNFWTNITQLNLIEPIFAPIHLQIEPNGGNWTWASPIELIRRFNGIWLVKICCESLIELLPSSVECNPVIVAD